MAAPVNIPKDWCMNMAAKEGDAEIGAGRLPPSQGGDGDIVERL
jgi:hypothetical protein